MTIVINSPKYGQHFVFADDEDFELISKYKWGLRAGKNSFYALAHIYQKETQNNKQLFMHTLIMGQKGVDHKDHNGLNNLRSNLRIATQSQNAKNQKVSILNKYGLKGVSFDKNKKLFSAHITCEYKHFFLGYFTSLVDASKAYNEAAKRHHGDFAELNIISEEREVELRNLDLPKTIKKRVGKKSSHKGVSIYKGRFYARITVSGKTKSLGGFDTELAAALAYENESLKIKNNE